MSYDAPPPPPPGDNPPGGYPPPPPGSYPPAGGYGEYAAAPKDNTKAMVSMILGIVGVTICCGSLILSVVAVVLSILATKEIAGSGGVQGGETKARVGLITGIIGIVFGVIWGILLIAGVVNFSGTSTSP
jgi:hypothetical protein